MEPSLKNHKPSVQSIGVEDEDYPMRSKNDSGKCLYVTQIDILSSVADDVFNMIFLHAFQLLNDQYFFLILLIIYLISLENNYIKS